MSPVLIRTAKKNGTYLVEWEHTLDLHLLSHYTIYKQQPDKSFVYTSTRETRVDLQNTGFDLVANENLLVAAFSQTPENDKVIFLPALSNQSELYYR